MNEPVSHPRPHSGPACPDEDCRWAVGDIYWSEGMGSLIWKCGRSRCRLWALHVYREGGQHLCSIHLNGRRMDQVRAEIDAILGLTEEQRATLHAKVDAWEQEFLRRHPELGSRHRRARWRDPNLRRAG